MAEARLGRVRGSYRGTWNPSISTYRLLDTVNVTNSTLNIVKSYQAIKDNVPVNTDPVDTSWWVQTSEVPTGDGVYSRVTSLTDTPDSYTNMSGKVLIVNDDESGLEFIDNSNELPKFVVGDGTTDNSPLFIQEFENLLSGSVLKLEPGKVYRCDSDITVDMSEKDVYINLNGSTILFSSADLGFTFDGGWQSVQSFGSISADGLTVTGITDTSLLEADRMIRLVSDDVALDSSSTDSRQAEDLWIDSIIDSTSIKLLSSSNVVSGKENTAYTTNPRIAQSNGHKLVMYNGLLSHVKGLYISAWTDSSLCRLYALSDSLLYNVSSPFSYSSTINPVACINTKIIGGHDEYHHDKSYAGDQFGYGDGIIDASFGTIVVGRTGSRLRHLVDTIEQAYGDGQDPKLYGGSTGLSVNGCVGSFTTDYTFGSQHTARGLSYNQCKALHSAGYGYGIRGDVTLHGCESIHCVGDVNTFDDDNVNPSKTRLTAYNHKATDTGIITNSNLGTPVNFYNYVSNRAVYANGSSFLSAPVGSITNFRGHTSIEFTGTPASQVAFGTLSNGTVNFDTMEWDVSSSSIDGSSSIYTSGSIKDSYAYTGVLRGDRLSIKGNVPSAFIQGNALFPADKGQLKFDVSFEDGVAWYTSTGNSTSNIVVAKGGDLVLLGDINVVSDIDSGAGRYVSNVVDFGAAVDDGVSVKATYSVEGYLPTDTLNFGTQVNADIRVDNTWVEARDIVSIRITNVSGGTLDLSAVTVLNKISKM